MEKKIYNQKLSESSDNDNENNKLKNELSKAKKEIKNLNKIIQELQNKLNNYDSTIAKLKNDIKNYKKIISKKEIELNNNINDNQNNINFNDTICVNFISTDQTVHFVVPCQKKDIFAEIEEKLYKQYPEYRETNNTFISNGTLVLRFKTIDENQIGDESPVILISPS